ncbi:GAF domain-containing protein [Variovorax guangxiensis]|uniref:GAF domain-containing protein n=1 Tax=Variovorax guangxiensis TaxID=1775474 RepID=UPI00285BB7D3|nr:GAF domain-containing protein [Variovorax guangxiensis]MDR6860442.1 GAF domain-containing protein [Variovorax guangxiensis]
MSVTDRALFGSCEQAFETLDHELRRFPGHRLFSVLAIDGTLAASRRLYTSDPASYPCGGTKPLHHDSDFFREVVMAGRARICTDREACRRAFPDHALIDALGCRSAINVPIRHGGRTIGSLNLLHQEHWYQPGMAPALAPFAELAAPLLFRLQHLEMPS